MSAPTFLANSAAMRQTAELVEMHAARARAGGSERAVALHKRRGKLLPRERLQAVLDVGAPFLELSPLAGHELYEEEYVPGGGLVTGVGIIEGRKCMLIANDPTTKGGTVYPITVQKQLRAQEIALENRLPCVYLLESGGGNLPRQADIFLPGGRTFYNMARMSAEGLTQISVVLGSCTAGGAYSATMADEVIIVKGKGTLFLGGPPLVQAATGEVVSAEDLGGAEVHVSISGCADHLADDEPHALRLTRQLVANLPPAASESLPRVMPAAPLFDPREIVGLVPTDPRQPLPMRDVLARLLDGSELQEFKAEYGSTLITGFGRVEGYCVGVVANDGILFSESAQKGAHFIQLCCQRGIPLLFLQNITGFMVGKQYEHGGIAKHGAKLIHAVSNASVPKLSIVLGNSFGAGNYGMCGRAFGPRFSWMWPNAKVGIMGGQQAATTLSLVQQQAARRAGTELTEEKLAAMRARIEASFDAESSALYSTARLWDDGIIEPERTRETIALGLSIAANAPLPPNKFGVFRM